MRTPGNPCQVYTAQLHGAFWVCLLYIWSSGICLCPLPLGRTRRHRAILEVEGLKLGRLLFEAEVCCSLIASLSWASD